MGWDYGQVAIVARIKNPHTFIKNVGSDFEMRCDNCGDTDLIKPPMPMPLEAFTAWMKAFEGIHRSCRPKAEGSK